MSKIEALKELGYKYITKNKYINNKPHNNFITAWIYKPITIDEHHLDDNELIYWTNGMECENKGWEHWTQIHIENCLDFDCVDENATKPFEIK
jgi:hypothetical protein